MTFDLVAILNDSNNFWESFERETALDGPKGESYSNLHNVTQLMADLKRLQEVIPLLDDQNYINGSRLRRWALTFEADLEGFLKIATPALVNLATVVELTVGVDYLAVNEPRPLDLLYDVLERKLTMSEGLTTIQRSLESRKTAGETDPMIDVVLTELTLIELQLVLEAP